jgi:hypothetical protein
MNAWFGRVGTKDALPEKMPSIWLVIDPKYPQDRARSIADGCEEEGIPLAWDIKAGSAEELAHFASLRSQLEVGIGIGPDGESAIALVAVTDKPYIKRRAEDKSPLRWLGQAAARLSKSQPIPGERTTHTPPPDEPLEGPENTSDVSDLVQLVTTVLMKMQEGVD